MRKFCLKKGRLVQILIARNNGAGILSPSLEQLSYEAFETQLLEKQTYHEYKG